MSISLAALIKPALRVLGFAILAASVVFVLRRLVSQLAELQALLSWEFVALIVTCSLAYTLSLHGLSMAWYRLLRWLGPAPGSAAVWHGIYARTSIAKYLPGNVFHFAGRHLLGRKLGATDLLLAAAAIYELFGLAGAALLIASFGTRIWLNQDWFVLRFLPYAAVGSSLLVIFAGARWLPALLVRFGRFGTSSRSTRAVIRGFGPCLVLYLAFIGTSSAIAYTFAAWLGPEAHPWLVVPAYAAAWVVGFAVPGSSGGLGVREAVLLLLLEHKLAPGVGLQVAISTRVVTTLGDLLFLFVSFAWPVPQLDRGQDSRLADVNDERG